MRHGGEAKMHGDQVEKAKWITAGEVGSPVSQTQREPRAVKRQCPVVTLLARGDARFQRVGLVQAVNIPSQCVKS
ncbi:hypothetical protein RRG08_045524 [Elysia crispata]|uniref:Uncharacterized protein n=1 Tax=Elysia crispata TaxID=231223 RepID=A0AAE0YD59_9GAST|nr:hypothetical protein RRG08_045524 [Elysia crispata]